MKRTSIAILIVLTACVCSAKVTAKANEVKPTDRLKSYEKGFPYETRVDRETIAGKAIHWYSDGHAVTVTPHRVNCVYLTNTIDAAVLTVKSQKAAQKSAKKDEKNIDKAIKELEKLKAKSSESLQPLYDEAIKLFEGVIEDNR